MKTIKIIDLLNKIANGENIPREVNYNNHHWVYSVDRQDYIDEDGDNVFNHSNYFIGDILNQELEIIEDTPKEDNKIEKIDIRVDGTGTEYVVGKRFGKAFGKAYLDYAEKINEIIDKVNGEDNE